MELSTKTPKRDFSSLRRIAAKNAGIENRRTQKGAGKATSGNNCKKCSRFELRWHSENMSNLKIELSSSLDKLGDKFVSEFKKFEELQQAIQIEKKALEDLYQLSANADSLSVMLLVQKEKKQQYEEEMASLKSKFEEEMAQTRLQWKKQQEETAEKLKEEADAVKKNRQREEEDYQYNLKLTRKKETDLYEEKKSKLEKN